MIREFTLTNFKAFAAEQRIPLRPITLVFGANSSGKSSVLHSLLLARHAHDTSQWDAKRTSIGGDSVDLGGFAQYVHRRQSQNLVSLAFNLALNPSAKLRSECLRGSTALRVILDIGPRPSRRGQRLDFAAPALRNLTLEVDGLQLFRIVRAESGELRLSTWETDHPASRPLFEGVMLQTPRQKPLPEDHAMFVEALGSVMEGLTIKDGKLLPTEVEEPVSSDPVGESRMKAAISGDVKELIPMGVRLYFPGILRNLLADVNTQFATHLERLEYLGPLRSYPSRFLSEDESNDPNWHAGGGFAWQVVQENDEVRAKVNAWLEDPRYMKTPYSLAVDRLIHESTAEQAMPDLLRGRLLQLLQALAEREREKGDSLFGEVELNDLLSDHDAVAAFLEQQAPDLLDEMAKAEHDMVHSDGVLKKQEPDYVASYTLEKARARVLQSCRDGLLPEWEYEEVIKAFIRHDDTLQATLNEMMDIEHSARRFVSELAKADPSPRSELRLIDQRTKTAVTHRDVGIGISQVLPVLVHAYASKNKLIAIEQPEIHLHPALQAELGDLFIESALGENGNQFILETHSEHLILRLLRRIRETKRNKLPEGKRALRVEDISILYVAPEEQGSRVLVMNVNEHGKLTNNWPEGFFEERLAELF